MKLNFRFEHSKLLRMKLNDEVTKMGGKTYILRNAIILITMMNDVQ